MPALTRRHEKDRHQECWHIFYGDVLVGTIGERAGVPVEADQWSWHCGFSPAIDRGLRAGGTARTFEVARADFTAAWESYLPRCTEADFDGYRRQRAWTRWKYAMQDSGCKLPTQVSGLSSQCFCGAVIDCARRKSRPRNWQGERDRDSKQAFSVALVGHFQSLELLSSNRPEHGAYT